MENIGQVTVDLSGSLALTKDLCDKLGLVPGEKLAVSRGYNGEVSLTPLDKTVGEIAESTENFIDRQVGTALQPRQVGRVSEGSEVGEMKLVNKDGVLVFTLEHTEPLPDVVAAWLNDPVKYDRDLRMRELVKGSGFESLD